MHTDFALYNHHQLHGMLRAGDPKAVRAAAERWDAFGARLHEQAAGLEARLRDFRQWWQGGAAEKYQTMVGDLCGGLRGVADRAFAMRDLAHDAADALTEAQRKMPPPVAVPTLDPSTTRLANTPLQFDPMTSPQVVDRLQRHRSEAVDAVRAHQSAVKAANAAHAQAIAVMTELAGHYAGYDRAITATDPSADTGTGQGGQGGRGGVQSVPNGTGKPLFGNMFAAGLVAATAAAGGRFGLRRAPVVPRWAVPKKKDERTDDKESTPPTTAPVVPDDVDKLTAGGSLGGGGIGGGALGGLGGGFSGAPAPVAAQGMSGGLAAATGMAGPPPVMGGAATGSAMGGMMPMMPMMPFGGMNGDMAGGRRIPPWLVETEDVWGESSAITPSVIGDEPDDDVRY